MGNLRHLAAAFGVARSGKPILNNPSRLGWSGTCADDKSVSQAQTAAPLAFDPGEPSLPRSSHDDPLQAPRRIPDAGPASGACVRSVAQEDGAAEPGRAVVRRHDRRPRRLAARLPGALAARPAV